MYPFFDIEFYAQEHNFKISNSVKYGVGFSLLLAKNMQRMQLF